MKAQFSVSSMNTCLNRAQAFCNNAFTICILKVSLLTLLILPTSFVLKADAPRAAGYYIDNEGKRYDVTILVGTLLFSDKVDVAYHQNGFRYLNKKGEKVRIEPHEAQEFGFTHKNEKYVFRFLFDRFQASSLGKKHTGNFHLVLLDGACQVYQYEMVFSKNDGTINTHSTDFILVKSKWDAYYARSGMAKLAFNNSNNKTLEEFFADCPDLVAKIKAKEFKKMDDKWIKMADFYNTNCQTGDSGNKESDPE